MLRPLAVAALAIAAPVVTQPVAPSGAQAAITAAMEASAAGWNAGDLDRFTAIYADDAVFQTKDGLLRSKAEIAARYRPSFNAAGNSRGRLGFQTVAFRQLSPVHALYIARYTLTPAGAAPTGGMTTLLFERRREGWRIISDASS